MSVSNTPDDAISVLVIPMDELCREDLTPALEAVLDGHFMPLVFLLTLPVAATAIPVLYFLLVTYISRRPALVAHHHALDAPDALEQHAGLDCFRWLYHRLASSKHPEERNSVLLGFHPDTEYPVLLDVELLREHMHVSGPRAPARPPSAFHSGNPSSSDAATGPSSCSTAKATRLFSTRCGSRRERPIAHSSGSPIVCIVRPMSSIRSIKNTWKA